jgi:hypothetical protein
MQQRKKVKRPGTEKETVIKVKDKMKGMTQVVPFFFPPLREDKGGWHKRILALGYKL